MRARRQSARVSVGSSIERENRADGPRLADPEGLFQSAFDEAPVGIAVTSLEGRFLAVNRALCELTGRTSQQLLKSTIQEITHPDDVLGTVRDARRLLTGSVDAGRESEKRYLRPDGSIAWAMLRMTLVRDAEGEPLHLVSHLIDISDWRQAAGDAVSAMRRGNDLARVRDPLTGLRNHRDFREALEIEIERAARYDRILSLALFDVDDFTAANSERGRAHGDAILVAVAGVIEEVSRRPDLAARIGGDEFALILPETEGDGARRAAERVSERLAQLYDLDIGLSFGIAVWTNDLETGEELLWAAERAMDAGRRHRDLDESQLRIDSL